MTPLLLAVGGAVAVLLIVTGILPGERRRSIRGTVTIKQKVLRFARMDEPGQRRARQVELGVGTAVGLVAALTTGWFALVLLGPAAAIVLPGLVRRPQADETLVKLTALETWCRSLVGLMESRSTLDDAIKASQLSAPAAIREPVSNLSARLRGGTRLDRALRAFADDIADPIGDAIAVSLIVGGSRPGGTASSLEELAEAVAREVYARTQVHNERAGPRNALRIITLIVLAVLVVGATSGIASEFIAPYASPIGQAMLLFLGAGFLACLLWVQRIVTGEPAARLLTPRGGA